MKKKKKTKTLAKLKKDLWDECKRVIRKKYPNVCYTCNKRGLTGSDWQTGHGKPNGALSLKYKYDLRNLRPQCLHCNLNLGGCSDIFIAKLEKEKIGKKFLKEACVKVSGYWEVKHTPPMGSIDAYVFVTDLLDKYKKL